MSARQRLKIAVQKNGRLNNESLDLLSRCGLNIKPTPSSLLCHVQNLPIDLLFVRDDDIPTLVKDNICDLGIVGQNVVAEKSLEFKASNSDGQLVIAKPLGFCHCRLSIASPKIKKFTQPQNLAGIRIATSYPYLLRDYLQRHNITANVINISGSVEIAPRLDLADAICDLVSTGRTLEENNLEETFEIMKSEAVLLKTSVVMNEEKQHTYELLLRRLESVLKAQESKYIMFHAPKSALAALKDLLPGCERPTITALEGTADQVAVHVVSNEKIFWVTLEKLKQYGASSILVLPIEKMIN